MFLTVLKAIPTLILLTGMGFVLKGGYDKYKDFFMSGEKLQQLQTENHKLSLDNVRLALANQLLKVDHQLARVRVKAQYMEDGELKSIIEFWEVDDDNNQISDTQVVKIRGDKLYIQGLVAKFEDKFVEKGDPLRGAAMFAFKTIYDSKTAPEDGVRLNSHRTQPAAYKLGSPQTPFEIKIWRNFWDIANDPTMMNEYGLKAAHGQGVFIEIREGKSYDLRLGSTGDITIVPAKSHRKPKPWNRDSH